MEPTTVAISPVKLVAAGVCLGAGIYVGYKLTEKSVSLAESGIAKAKGTTVSDIMSKNAGILDANKIRAGSKVFTGNVPTPPKRTNEETVNELSDETLTAYKSAAEKQMSKIAKKDPMNTTFADTNTYLKRKAGVELAGEKSK